MRLKDNKIILEHGFIEVSLIEVGSSYHKYPTIEFVAEYERKEYDIFKYKTFDSLYEAYEWYKNVDLNMRGI